MSNKFVFEDDFGDEVVHDFMHGLCSPLAYHLHKLLKKSKYVMLFSGSEFIHAVCYFQGYYIDVTGIYTCDELHENFKTHFERDLTYIKTFNAKYLPNNDDEWHNVYFMDSQTLKYTKKYSQILFEKLQTYLKDTLQQQY
jgi:hypothetical protein